jgi:hypothetical protein
MRVPLVLALLFPSTVVALDGQVINRPTAAPLQGVFVIARWVGNASFVVQPATRCYRADITVTDDKGRYHVAESSGNLNPLLNGRRRVLSFYKPGFREVERKLPGEDLVVLDRRDKSDPEKAFVEVAEIDVVADCGLAERRRLDLLKAQVGEMASLATTGRQKEIVHGTQYSIDLIQRGEESARRNLDERLFGRAARPP